MRIKYPIEIDDELKQKQTTYTLEQMVNYINNKWNINTNCDKLRSYLSKRKIRYIGYKPSKATSKGLPIGTERKNRDDGMIMVKTLNGWDYKQRVIWKEYFGEIPKNHFIIFLDGDRNNYDISNLKCVSSREASLMANYHLFSKDKEVTETGALISQLIIQTKNKEGKKITNHKKGRR